MHTFKHQLDFPFDYRKKKSIDLRTKHPDRLPVIVEEHHNKKRNEIKFLVPNDLTVGQFIYMIRNKLKLNPEKAMFLFINNKMFPSSYLFSQITPNDDGFIYVYFSFENVFG